MDSILRQYLTIVVLALSLYSSASANGYNFYRFGIEEGLPQNYIYTLVQDTNSYLWVGTGEGLSRFDGSNFELFTKDQGLSDNFVTASYRDQSGMVWFGHFDGTISCENGNGFNTYRVDSIPLSRINAIYEDHDKRLWFVTQNSGLICYHQETKQLELLYDGLQEYLVYGIVQHPQGHFLLATQEGLLVMQDPVNSSLEISKPLSDFPNVRINKLVEKKDGSGFFLGTEYFGFFSCSYSSSNIGLTIDLNAKVENRLSSNTIETIFEDREGNIWLGTDNGRLHLLNPKNYEGKVTRIDISLTGNKPIRTVFQDRENNIWLGTYGGGLFQLKNKLFNLYSEWQGLTSSQVNALLIGEEELYWVATDEGLTLMNFDDGTTTSYTETDGLPENKITALHKDAEGMIWCGTANSGLFCLKWSVDGIKITIPSDPLQHEKITSIATYQGQTLAVGTENNGVFLIDKNSRKIEQLTLTKGLSHNDVRQVFADSKNRLWLAVHGGPINMYSSNEIHYYGAESNVEGFNFNSFSEDREGNIWIGSYGNGIYKYDGTSFTHYDRSNGLLSDYVYSISCDPDGNVWVGTKLGLSKLEAFGAKVVNFPAAEHFESAEINLNATVAAPNGDLWFGSNKGLIRFLSSSQELNKVPPKINIAHFRINGETYPTTSNIDLPYGNYTIDLDYVAISLTNPKKVAYQYQLEGYENEWSNVTSERSVRYSSLENGSYVFKLRATNADGIFTPKPFQLRFTIKSPYWQTWWFRLLGFLAFGGVVFGFVQLRVRIYKQRQAELQHLVNERTAELQKEKEKVETQNNIIGTYYQDITSSISYAKRIQDSVLPPKRILQQALPGRSFMLWKPRDIVSGDFPWFNQYENRILVSAADCTGHGVPGAFMSLIGHAGFLQAVKQQRQSNPGKVLDSLNQMVTKTLLSGESGHKMRDGMDVALCTIHTEEKVLEFAGANNPLYILRQNLASTELGMDPKVICFEDHLGEIKGDKRPIGNYPGEEQASFTTHVISYQPGDRFYIFSDGYADQFGGPKGKKFMYKQFKRLLISIFELPMDQQQKILNDRLLEWQDQQEQVDDILVIGFEP